MIWVQEQKGDFEVEGLNEKTTTTTTDEELREGEKSREEATEEGADREAGVHDGMTKQQCKLRTWPQPYHNNNLFNSSTSHNLHSNFYNNNSHNSKGITPLFTHPLLPAFNNSKHHNSSNSKEALLRTPPQHQCTQTGGQCLRTEGAIANSTPA